MNKEWWINPKFIKPQDPEHWEAHTDFDIPAILAEHSKLIVEMLEGMKKEKYWCGEDPETEEMREMNSEEPCSWGGDMSFAFNTALDEAIKKIKEL